MTAAAAGLALVCLRAGTAAQEPPAAAPPVNLPALEVTAKAPGNKPARKALPKRASKPAALAKPATPSAAAPVTASSPPPQASTAGAVDGYRALTSVSSLADTPLESLPQTIQVVPRSLIDDQNALSIDEALQNVSGTQGTLRLQTPAYDMSTIRGFAAEQWLDGMPVFYNPGHRDALANVERIEVLKGPSAILYGGGAGAPVGGAINVVSKMPTPTPRNEVGVTVASYGYVRPYIDVNQPVTADGSVLFRFVGEYANADSFIDAIETETYSINPTFVFTDKRDTKLTIQGRATRWQAPEYQGLPATGTVAGTFRIDPDLFIGPDNLPDSSSELHSVTAKLEHDFSDALSATATARWRHSKFHEQTQSLVGSDGLQGNIPFVGPSTWFLTNGDLGQEQNELAVSASMRAKFSLAGARHTLVAGADYSHIDDQVGLFADFPLGGAGFVDLTDPVFAAPYVRSPRTPATTLSKSDAAYVTQGAFVQLQTDIAGRIHLLAGVRLADIRVDAFDHVADTPDVAKARELLPRLGALVDIYGGVSAYASYSEGVQSHYLSGQRGIPDPEHSRQYEAGLKYKFANGLSGTTAVFEIERTDVPLIDFNLFPVDAGRERSSGVETDLLWQPGRNWQILASYAFIDTVQLDSVRGSTPGGRRIGVPEHSGRLWVNYSFDPDVLKGWSIGAGLYAATDQAVDFANQFFTDNYMTVDAKLAYASDGFNATASVKNLTDELYYVSHFYLGGRVARGDARTYVLTVSQTF